MASNISTASSLARPRNTSRRWCATPPWSTARATPQGYHLSEDIADDAIIWLREQSAYAPDKPFFMYWAPGASHGPHQITQEWADKYKGKFDDGWDKYRERVFANAKAKGWIPQDTQLTPRPASMASWDSIPEDEKPFQRRLMEVFAGFTEHADFNAGRVIAEIERQGKLDNTLIFYIWGDNGSSAEGLNGTISETARAERDPDHDRATSRGPGRAGRAGCAGLAQDRQHVSRRLGLGGQHAVQVDQARRCPLRRHTPAHGGRLAQGHQGRRHAACAVPPCHRRRADDLRGDEDHAAQYGQRLSAGLHRWRQHGLHLCRHQGRRSAQDPVLRHHGQSGDLSRRLVCQRHGPTRALGGRHAEGCQGMVAGKGPMGALQPERGLEPGQRPCRARCRTSSRK